MVIGLILQLSSVVLVGDAADSLPTLSLVNPSVYGESGPTNHRTAQLVTDATARTSHQPINEEWNGTVYTHCLISHCTVGKL